MYPLDETHRNISIDIEEEEERKKERKKKSGPSGPHHARHA
jgi:hypothetical protein